MTIAHYMYMYLLLWFHQVEEAHGEAWCWTDLWQRLQGGDAFVAGTSRIFAAYYGHVDIMRAMAWVGIFHSLFEIWLLPRGIKQVQAIDGQLGLNKVGTVALWGFVLLHVGLVLLFSLGIAQSHGSL